MTTYKVPKLSTNTPKADRSKLEKNLEAITGAESVKLHPEKSEVSISFGKASMPSQQVIETAMKKSGFSLSASN